jgi:uncharacterized phage-associated protein
MAAKYTVDQVADTLIYLARSRNIEITNLKLQKLLYYAQAWNLVFTGDPLFDDAFEAWVHGPVVPRVFRRFKEYRWNVIGADVSPIQDDALVAHLGQVLDTYGKFGAAQLERLTHQEKPWQLARRDYPVDASSNEVIDQESMREFYSNLK